MQSTMQDFPLTIGMVLRHGRRVHADQEVVTWEGDHGRRATFAEVAERAERLAAALARLGVGDGDRVGTAMWNEQEHLEAYFAVPAMGAVLHTLNIRLFPEQLEYIVNHAADRVVILDDTVLPLIASLAPRLDTVEHFVVVGEGDVAALAAAARDGVAIHRYEELLAAEAPGFDWPELDERAAAAMCYTSGTTGNPKGVVYSHRSIVLHSFGGMMVDTLGLNSRDRLLAIVPMFHVNAWGLPFAAYLCGAAMLLPGRFLQPEPMCAFIQAERPTCAGAVPTIWSEMLRYVREYPVDLSSFRLVMCGGAAVPRALMEAFEHELGVRVVQGWGMTETSPIGAVAHAPNTVELGTPEEMDWRARTGRVVPGVELRIVGDDGAELPWDDEAVGEVEIRGPWITGAYYLDPAEEKFRDGWLRTGDVGRMSPNGYLQITDRAKDVIKSGGEWISSVELENLLMAHPDVLEASVVAVPDPKWDERPLACVVRAPGSTVDAAALREFLSGHLAKWQVPERWSFVEEIPKTSVGKFDKKVLRARYAEDELPVETL